MLKRDAVSKGAVAVAMLLTMLSAAPSRSVERRPTQFKSTGPPSERPAQQPSGEEGTRKSALELATQPVEGVTFKEVTRDFNGVSVQGQEARPESVAPEGLGPAEREAWMAKASRDAEPEVKTFFPANYTDRFVVEGDGVRVALRAVGGNAATSQAEDGRMVYRAAYAQTDSIHRVEGGRSEELLLLHSAAAPKRFDYEIVSVEGATQVLEHNGAIRFVDVNGRGLEIERPWLVDADGHRTEKGVQWVLGEKGPSGSHPLRLVVETQGLTYPIAVDPSWTTVRRMTFARSDHSATLLQTGKVLVAGGVRSSTLVNSNAELYDPATGSWSLTGSLATARHRHTATVLLNGRVLVVGGSNGSTSLATAEVYDPATGAWAATGNMAVGRERHTATLLPDGRVLAVGGSNGSGSLATAEIYDASTGVWTSAGNLTAGRAQHTSTLLSNGKVLIVGGWSGVASLASAEVYNPATNSWASAGSLTIARHLHSATLLPDDTVLIAYGEYGPGLPPTYEIFNVATGMWVATGGLLTERYALTATLLPNGNVLLAGGYQNSAELYNPLTGISSYSSSLAVGRGRNTATLLPDGRVLIAGGDNNSTYLSSTELYDPTAAAWAETGDLQTSVSDRQSTLLPYGKVLLVGGRVGGSARGDCETYDPASGTWTETDSLAQPRLGHTATLLQNGDVLVAGGRDGQSLLSAELYDASAGLWSTVGSLNTARHDHTATLLLDGRVLVVGGTSEVPGTNSTLSSAEIFDPVSEMWSPTGSLATPRYGHTSTLLSNGKVLVTAGSDGSSYFTTAELFDPATGSWMPTGSIEDERHYHTATLLRNGKVLVAGGIAGANRPVAVEIYDPASGAWTPTGSLPIGRYDHTATLLADGRVIIAGGWVGGGETASVQIYNPGTGLWTAASNLVHGRYRHTAALLADDRILVAGGSPGAPVHLAELYDPRLASIPALRPVLSLVPTSLRIGNSFTLVGTSFGGVSEAGGGGTQSSATNYPLVRLRSLAYDEAVSLLVDPAIGWSDTSFAAVPWGGLLPGPAILSVITNGIPSAPQPLTVVGIEQPVSLVAVAGSASHVNLSWQDDSLDETGFRVERMSAGGNWVEVGTAGAGATNYSDLGLVPLTTYTYRVRAFNPFNSSPVSNEASVATPSCSTLSILQQPSSLTVQAGQTASLFVVATGAEPLAYQWYQQAVGGGFTPIAGATSSVHGTGPRVSTTAYRCRVTDACGSVDSAVATVTVELQVTSTADGGAGSLREAILLANQTDGVETIRFNFAGAGPHVITLSTPLPAIEKPVIVDGATQPGAVLGAPVVVLSGAAAGGVTVACGTDDGGEGKDGLHVAAGGAGTVIRGLAINGFTGDGIEFEGGGTAAAASRVEGCFIGTNAAGTAAVANGRHGVHINNAAYVTVGGDRYPNGSLRYGCLISGNTCSGVEIRGGLAANNLIIGCNIGPDLTGHIPIGNGVGVRVDGAPHNTIGAAGDDASKKNRVGFNSGQGTVNTGTVSTGPQGAMPPDTQIIGTEFYGNDGEAIETTVPIAPTLASAHITGTTLTVIGTATVMNPSTQYRVQYFTNTTCPGPPVVFGQGEVLIAGDVLKQSSPAGTLDLTFASSATTARPGELVAVTVTGPEGTSRFSTCQAVDGRLGVVAVETAVVNLGSLPGLRSGPTESGQTSPGLVASFAGPVDPDDPDIGDEPNELDDAVVPPDAQAAVGPDHLVAVLNTEIAVQSKTDGTFVKRVDLDGFWAALKETPQEVLSAFNPRALFDPYAAGGGRYVIVATANPRQDSSAVLVAVSKTTDPTGDWNLYRYEAETAEVLWADYPTVGFTKDWLAVQVNLFSIGLDQFARTEIFALNKVALYAGNPGVGAGTVLGSRTIGLTQVPAMTYDQNLTTLYLVQTGAGNLAGVGTVNVYTISGPVGGETLNTTPQAYTTADTWLTPEAPMGLFAPQMGTAVKIDANDDRMHSVVYRNGRLYLAHTVFLPAAGPATRSAVQWWELNPANQTVVQRGRIDDPAGLVYYAYPSLAVNSQGNVVIGYSRFSATTFATAAYQFREAGDAAGTLRGEAVLKAGEAAYDKRLGDVRNRWGDYSSATVDPVDDTKLWVLNEYAETPVTGTTVTVDRWGTWWGAVAGSPECTMTCPGNITIGTGAGASGCGRTVTYSAPATTGTCGTVTCAPASGSMFPVGTTTVTCNGTAGYACSFTVTVTDTTAPAINCPNPQTIAVAANCQAAVPNLVADAMASDNCPAVVTITQLPAAGTAIGLGTHPVTLTATDGSGNTATCVVNVTVADQTAPTVTCPGNLTMAAAAGACSRVVNFPLTVSDNCPGGITVTTSQPSGSEFAVGTTMVTVTATDAAGNVSLPCQFTVTVTDQQSPVIATCPGSIRTVALTSAGRTISYTPPAATDNCLASVSCVPAPGSTFAIGTTTVTCTATDAANNSTNCQFTVHVAPLGTDTAGIYVPATGSWFLRNANSSGAADLVFGYGPQNVGWIALRGDWDGDGTDTPGLYDPSTGFFFLRNQNAPGSAELVFSFGPGNAGFVPIVGDWNGDGVETIGIYSPSTGAIFLRNQNAGGTADLVFTFGAGGQGFVPIAGDWDGDGDDTVGLYLPSSGFFFLRNENTPGGADLVYSFGAGGAGIDPLVGDYDGDGDDTVGIYFRSSGFFFLRNSHAPGPADVVFGYGPANTTPILGDWNGL